MRLVGRPYGLNYGVSLPTLRRLARAETPDHDFAEFLFRQDVRELRLAAFHIAEPDRLTPDDSAFWAAGIDNNELAEEAAFALLSRAGAFPALFGRWIAPSQPLLLRYAALMAAGPLAAGPRGVDRSGSRCRPPGSCCGRGCGDGLRRFRPVCPVCLGRRGAHPLPGRGSPACPGCRCLLRGHRGPKRRDPAGGTPRGRISRLAPCRRLRPRGACLAFAALIQCGVACMSASVCSRAATISS